MPIINALCQSQVRKSRVVTCSLLLGLLTWSLVASAAETSETSQTGDHKTPIQVAFAGGGWRAHTGHSAWVMALLQQNDHSLKDSFGQVDTVSSNSGGSWFSSMLMYSPKFTEHIQAANAVETWATPSANASGWLGQQRYLFEQASCPVKTGDLFTLCVFDEYAGGFLGLSYWHRVIANLVFDEKLGHVKLSDERQPWARDKTLLMAASMLTHEAVVTHVGVDEQYYQACFTPFKPRTNGSKGAHCKNSATKAVVSPITFSSVRSSTASKPHALPFFRALKSGQSFNLGYSEAAWFFPNTAQTSVSNPIATDHLPVVVAASASSAAAGFAASKSVTGSWAESLLAADEALHFQTAGTLEHYSAKGFGAKKLAANKIIQVADGGAVDNSAVAQIVAYLQLNDRADDFNIVAFDNVQTLYTADNQATVGVDIANLFGEGLWQGDQICSQSNGKGDCVTVPQLQVFEKTALNQTPVRWQASVSGDDGRVNNSEPNGKTNRQALLYTKFRVTTVDNPEFGITGGKTGTLHAFTAAWSQANTAPQNSSVDFDAYSQMLDFIVSGLNQPGKDGIKGIEHLQRAFGH